jgi:hypothetical protein
MECITLLVTTTLPACVLWIVQGLIEAHVEILRRGNGDYSLVTFVPIVPIAGSYMLYREKIFV